MNKTAELVNQWAAFEANYPEAGIDDFCRYYLISKREEDGQNKLFDGAVPPTAEIILVKLVDRIAKLHMIYIRIAMKTLKISHFEEFNLLSAISNLQAPKKTEAIYHTINELSTGLNLLSKLKNKGYIAEQDDSDDKRSKRLQLTAKGEKVLQACYRRFSKVPEMLFKEMSREDIELCVQLLKNIDIRFSRLWQQHRGKPFEQIYESITGKSTTE
jgi:DNA-binding MarR family transcriptional regulator